MKNLFCVLLLFICVESVVISAPGDLDRIATKHFTDKGSWGHNYAEQYEAYFTSIRDTPIKLLEIGFYHGASALLWDEYFSCARLYHIDVDKGCYEYMRNLSSRSTLHMVDQSNANQLTQFAESCGGSFDVIIDDGSHMVEHQITSFKALFPYLKSGGVYVIEDLFSSYWKEYGGNGSRKSPIASDHSTVRFLQSLIDDVNYIGARNAYANIDVCPKEIVDGLSYYQRNIKSMHFFCNICFITKR